MCRDAELPTKNLRNFLGLKGPSFRGPLPVPAKGERAFVLAELRWVRACPPLDMLLRRGQGTRGWDWWPLLGRPSAWYPAGSAGAAAQPRPLIRPTFLSCS